MKKNPDKSCKIFEKWFSGSVGTKQNQTERLSQKQEPKHNQMFFEIRNQTQPKPKPKPKPDPNRTKSKRTGTVATLKYITEFVLLTKLFCCFLFTLILRICHFVFISISRTTVCDKIVLMALKLTFEIHDYIFKYK